MMTATRRATEYTAGVDFGGTAIKLGLVADDGEVVADTTIPTLGHSSPDALVELLAQTIRDLLRVTRPAATGLRGVGIGVPGLVDVSRGIVHELVNVSRWKDVPLGRLLRERLRCPCVVDNDVNVIALGEWSFGAGQGTWDSVYLTLGTGVGGGLVLNGMLLRGVSGSAGEIGHTIIQPDGPKCACGARGCLEVFIGTAGILRMAEDAVRRGKSSKLAKIAQEADGQLTPELISRAAALGDVGAKDVWERVGRYLGLTVASTINLLNPERVVIGGGIARAWRWFMPSLRRTVQEQAFKIPAKAVDIVPAALGTRAGIVGGAVLAWEQDRRVGGRGSGADGRVRGALDTSRAARGGGMASSPRAEGGRT